MCAGWLPFTFAGRRFRWVAAASSVGATVPARCGEVVNLSTSSPMRFIVAAEAYSYARVHGRRSWRLTPAFDLALWGG